VEFRCDALLLSIEEVHVNVPPPCPFRSGLVEAFFARGAIGSSLCLNCTALPPPSPGRINPGTHVGQKPSGAWAVDWPRPHRWPCPILVPPAPDPAPAPTLGHRQCRWTHPAIPC